jgi:nucleoside-diphosphate-sugar epimerase
MKVLVTGASGFLGWHLVEGLLARGHSVRCLVRRSSNLDLISRLPVEWCYGSLEDAESLARACKGVEAVCHLAGVTKALDESGMMRVNQSGTQSLLEACWRANPGVRRFLYCSSLAAAGPSPGSDAIDESYSPSPVSAYGRSKLAGERTVAEFGTRIPAVIIRPAPAYGPAERDIYAYFRLLALGLKLLPGMITMQTSLIYAADLVQLMLLALENDAAISQTYFASDGNTYELESILDEIACVLGRRTLRVAVPMGVLQAAAALGGLWAGISGRPLVLTADKLAEFKRARWLCTVDKARRELGFEPQTTLREGLKKTAAWYKEHGWL